jgi:hypothetical protein
MDTIAILIIRQTQHVTQDIWQSILVLGTVEYPPIQQNISITTLQPIVEIALTCAYCQQIEHEFKNCPFVDDKLKRSMKEELKTFLPLTTTSTP